MNHERFLMILNTETKMHYLPYFISFATSLGGEVEGYLGHTWNFQGLLLAPCSEITSGGTQVTIQDTRD